MRPKKGKTEMRGWKEKGCGMYGRVALHKDAGTGGKRRVEEGGGSYNKVKKAKKIDHFRLLP